ncbi:MAG: hypothetical protein ABSF80_07305 [Chitinispirillaceae bacterium]|jgi:hypothetical protein
MGESFKVIENTSGKRIFSIAQALPEEDYTLHFPNGQTKQIKGKVAQFDPDFNKAFSIEQNKIRGGARIREGGFLKEGFVYTKGREQEYINAIENSKWTSIESIAVYMPFEIEKIIRFAIFENELKIVTHFSYHNNFSPLHFFGLRVKGWKSSTDKFYISDGFTTTPVAEVKAEF